MLLRKPSSTSSRHEFLALGGDASDTMPTATIGAEIDSLSREAAALRKLRGNLFGVEC
jgi:hypothetical protein